MPRRSFDHAALPTPTQSADRRIGDLIETLFKHPRRRYGYRRLGEELAEAGEVCAPDRIRRIMRQRGLRALQPKSCAPKTSDGRAAKPSPNLLLDQPLPARPDLVWAGDITFIPTAAGWLYLAVVIDLCSRKIVGWFLADPRRADLVSKALGAIKAMKAAGMSTKDIPVGGVDATQEALASMKAGDLSVTVFQDAAGQGKGAVDTAMKLVKGEKVDAKVYIPFQLVTPENMANFMAKN